MSANDLANKLVDFDLDLTDFNKITALVCNLLDEYDDTAAAENDDKRSSAPHRIECRLGNAREGANNAAAGRCTCHRHGPDADSSDEACSFCQFLQIVRQENTKVRVSTSKSTDSSSKIAADKEFVYVNYKTLDLNSPKSQRHMLDANVRSKLELYNSIIEWSEYQVWRTPYAFVGYASCASQADLYCAIRNYEQVKKKFSKTLVTSKLFIDYHLKHELNDEFRKSMTSIPPLSPTKSSSSMLPSYSFDDASPKTKSAFMQRQLSTVNLPSIQQEKSFDRLSLSSLPTTNADSGQASFDYTTSNDGSLYDGSSLPAEIGQVEHELLNDDLKVVEENKIIDPLSAASLDEPTSEQEMPGKSDGAKVVLRPKLVKSQTIQGDDAFDEIELEKKLKLMKNELVYLDFLFSKSDLNANLKAIVISERNKIASSIRDSVLEIYKKLSAIASGISTSDEKQLNQYSEFLKTPVEKEGSKSSNKFGQVTKSTDSTLSFDSSLSIKMISRKTVAARMYKYKADLLMCLNQKDQALQTYVKAYQNCKKEQDLLWSASALLGLCISSYFCFFSNPATSGSKAKISRTLSTSTSANDLAAADGSKLTDLKSSFKRRISMAMSTDMDKFIISPNEYAQNFNQIVSTLSQNEMTRYISFEYSLMLAKFLVKNHLRSEAVEFLSFLIYTSLPVREEFRIRRYLEVGYLYDKCDFKRLSITYKWIGSSRIFQIIDKLKYNKTDGSQPNGLINKTNNEDISKNPFLKCLINKCISEFKETLDYLIRSKTPAEASEEEMGENVNPWIKQGFPMAKKYLLNQLIRLLNFTENYVEATKFCKYLLHEMHVYLNEYEMQYLCDLIPVLISTSKLMMNDENGSDSTSNLETTMTASLTSLSDPYDIKFYKIPFMNSFAIQDHAQQDFTRSGQIVQQPGSGANSIYIHRFVNPLVNTKGKKAINMYLNHLNRLDIEFTNPLTHELIIDRLSLVIETQSSSSLLVDLHEFTDSNVREFKIPPKALNYKVSTGFLFDQLGSYKITGYEIACFNCTNRILFSELLELNRHGSSYMRYGKDNSYLCKLVNKIKKNSFDVVVSPRLSLIKSIQLVDTKTDRVDLGSFLESGSQPILECFLGLKKKYQFKIAFDEQADSGSSEILDLTLNKFSNDKASSYGIKVDFKKTSVTRKDANGNDCPDLVDHVYGISVDSTSFCSDSDLNSTPGGNSSGEEHPAAHAETSMQFMFEVKYTNPSCRDENICQYFKRQLKLTFRQAFLVEGLTIEEIDERSFKINLRIKNLIDKTLSLVKIANEEKQQSGLVTLTPVDIEALSEASVSLVMEKFEIADVYKHLQSIGGGSEFELTNLMNELRLNDVRIKLDDSEQGEMFSLNLKKNESLFARSRHCLFKCPVQLRPSLRLIAESDEPETTTKHLYNLTIIASKPSGSEKSELDDFSCSLHLSKKLGHCFLASRPQTCQLPKSLLLFKEINLIANKNSTGDQDPIHLQLELRNEAIKLVNSEPCLETPRSSALNLKWNLRYDFSSNRVEHSKR